MRKTHCVGPLPNPTAPEPVLLHGKCALSRSLQGRLKRWLGPRPGVEARLSVDGSNSAGAKNPQSLNAKGSVRGAGWRMIHA